jgi:hypothetical protein
MKRKRKGRRGRNGHNPNGPVRKDGADRINIRVVDLLDVVPGNRTDTGKPIIMVTVSRADDIETIAFSLRDTARLAIHCIANLAEFDVPLAKQILEEHFLGSAGVQLNRMDRDGD